MTTSGRIGGPVTTRGGYAVDDLAQFVVAADSADMPDGAATLLRRSVLDSLGCAIAALDGETVRVVRLLHG